MTQKKAAIREEKFVEDQSVSPKKAVLKSVDSVVQETLKEAPKAKNIGEVLKVVRESKGESLKNIGAILRISEHYLQAIETMDTEGLPEQVHTLGFVRSYAHYLGVDPQKSVTQFKADIFSATQSTKKLSIPQPVDSTSLPTKKILWFTTLLLLIVLGAGYVYWGQSHLSLDHEIANLLRPLENRDDITPALVEPNFNQASPEAATVLEQPNL